MNYYGIQDFDITAVINRYRGKKIEEIFQNHQVIKNSYGEFVELIWQEDSYPCYLNLYITKKKLFYNLKIVHDIGEYVEDRLKRRGIKTLKDLKGSKNQKINYDLLRISAVCDMQFGLGSSSALLNGDIKIIKSEKTGKIRNVYCDKKHILSMRASDGLFTLKLEGGKILHKKMKKPMLRVIVDKDAASFVKQGKSVFAKFVKECDPELRPFDECLIVNDKDELLAVGRCLLNRLEMLSFNYGMAVKTRDAVS